jgi:hypothetical protein
MNRQLKGFAAMNTIAENLRGRTAATREVEFAVNNSKENKTMFGIKRVAIGDGERGLLYRNRPGDDGASGDGADGVGGIAFHRWQAGT